LKRHWSPAGFREAAVPAGRGHLGHRLQDRRHLVPDLAAEELAVCEQVPVHSVAVDSAAAADPVQAVYLPPFYHSERSLASALGRLLSTGADRLKAFQSVDWRRPSPG